MHAKKLNTSKIVKGKAVTKAIDPKKKLPIFPDQSDDYFRQSPMKEAQIKKEVSISHIFLCINIASQS